MKKNKLQFDKKELIITIGVLLGTLVLGFFLGKALFEAIY